jgi:beta-exotoxin I transport system ATP-binding protein
MSGAPVIEIEHLSRRFGRLRAIEDLSLAVEAGEILGFLGPNGAGKTTTVRTLMGFLRPTAGSARVLGVWPGDDVGVRSRIGYLPGDVRIEPGMRASHLFAWFARLRGVSTKRAHELSERLGLDPSRPFGTLSKGNRQKVGLVQAFLHDPEVIVLDEPSTGLDPVVQRELLAIIREAAARGAAVLFSSHVLPEVERIAGRVAVLRAGRLVTLAPVRDLLDRARHRLELSFADPVQPEVLRDVPGVVDLLVDSRRLDIVVDGPVGPVLKAATGLGTLLRVAPAGDELEDLFFTEARG